jgi:hypothetical protein
MCYFEASGWRLFPCHDPNRCAPPPEMLKWCGYGTAEKP